MLKISLVKTAIIKKCSAMFKDSFPEIRARFHDQRFPPKSLPKKHALQSTVTIFHGIITVSQYG